MSQSAEFDDSGDSGDVDESGALPGFVTDPVGVLKRRWMWMVPVLLIGAVLSGYYLYQRSPEFAARATILVSSQKISQQFFISTIESDQLEKVSAILGELLSRKNLAKLVAEHNPYSVVGDVQVLTLEDKIGMMRSRIVIGPDRRNAANFDDNSSATVFEVRFTSGDAQKTADIVNALATGFTDIHLRMRSRQARLTTDFLRAEQEQAEEDLSRQERKITEFKKMYRGELPSELATSLGRLDRLQSQRQSLALQIAETESRLASLAASGNDVELDSPEALLRSLRTRYKSQRSLYTEDHPNLVAIRRQIESLQAQIADDTIEVPLEAAQATTLAGAARFTLTELRRQLAQTETEFEVLDRHVALVPERQEELAGLEQRAEFLRENHRELLRKVSQAELAQAVESAQQGERATVIDRAVTPIRPDSSPLKMLVVLIVGTFGAAIALAILLELIDPVIVSTSEIEANYRIPVIGSIPRLDETGSGQRS